MKKKVIPFHWYKPKKLVPVQIEDKTNIFFPIQNWRIVIEYFPRLRKVSLRYSNNFCNCLSLIAKGI